MKLTKRQAIVALVAGFAEAFMPKKAEGQQAYTGTVGIADPFIPYNVLIGLDNWDQARAITVEYKGERVIISAEEIMAALRGAAQ